MFLMESYLFKFFGVLLATFLLIFAWFKRKYSYWKTLGVEYEEPTIPFGNLADGFRRNDSIGEWYASFYQRMKDRKLKHAGSYFFSKPLYVPLDLELIKRIMQTDFAHFTDHGGPMNEKDDPLTAHLFTLGGQKWRTLRVKLTPTFTSGKMKMMFPIMVKISEELGDTLNRECKNGEALIDIKDISARFTTDVIVNCAFGLDCSSLKDPNAEFRIQGRRLSKLTLVETIVNFLAVQFPGVINFFGVRILPKEPADFFWNAIKETVEYRMKNDVRRNDALQLLMDMLGKEGENEENTLTFKELAAQAFLFYIAGYETSSTLISFVMVELSANQEIQDKLRHEIDEVLDQNNGELTYEAVHSMRYLDMVINESLRKYPPLPQLPRLCTKDYQVPDTEIIIKKGDGLFIPIKGIHHDPEYYPDPERFDPERFTEENKSKRHQFAYIPFGEGPRMCLGLRFGLMQAKVGLTLLLRNFRFKLNSGTKMPIKLDPKNFLASAEGDLLIDIEKINRSDV